MKGKTIGILTSGGDAPGMNATIRAIVLAAHKFDHQCIGFMHGYNGLIHQQHKTLVPDDVANVIHKGGTILKSARCPEMLTEQGITQAVQTLTQLEIDVLIVIGGDGSFNGMLAIEKLWQGQLIGLPGTIDNDIDGTDFTIGFSTAINTAIEAIDKIRDTADAFDRVFVIELMGRQSGHIAFNVGIACGAEQIISFENFQQLQKQQKLNAIIEDISAHRSDAHKSYLIVLAENLWPGGAHELANQLKQQANIDCGLCILGHIQRGGSPVAKDRILATRLGVAAVQALNDGKTGVMLGELKNDIVEVPLSLAVCHTKHVADNLVSAHENILALAAQHHKTVL
ncbi:MAG: ATP-dependent 6-phosphofructokinase [Gammaproteobacteria bacterium]|nr:ATP-dependent 6-phosphofructokinase [Gammaproteobacteria bacterium]